jgi:hypothetical protein
MLLSSIAQDGRPTTRAAGAQKASDSNNAVTDMLNDQPILSPD